MIKCQDSLKPSVFSDKESTPAFLLLSPPLSPSLCLSLLLAPPPGPFLPCSLLPPPVPTNHNIKVRRLHFFSGQTLIHCRYPVNSQPATPVGTDKFQQLFINYCMCLFLVWFSLSNYREPFSLLCFVCVCFLSGLQPLDMDDIGMGDNGKEHHISRIYFANSRHMKLHAVSLGYAAC